MTTLAIIGSGIAGRSLLYNLARQNSSFKRVLLFESDAFASPCSLHSTAIVAPRGVTQGHSPLGDLILEGFSCFSNHVDEMAPTGVYRITQYTGLQDELDQFKLRYPNAKLLSSLGEIHLTQETCFATEEAFMIDPPAYLNWLMCESEKKLPLERIGEFVVKMEKGEKIKIHTQSSNVYEADHVVFATGAASRFWKDLSSHPKLASSRPVQGAYLKFKNVIWDLPSFSMTFEGSNLIYNQETQNMLVGSTTHQSTHILPPIKELREIYLFLKHSISLKFPDFSEANIMVGHREKAQKREPYLFTEGNFSFIGGLYKNGFTLSLKMTRSLAHQLLDCA